MKSGRVWLAKGEADLVLDQIMDSVPALCDRSRKSLLTRLCALHKSEPLESGSNVVSVEAVSPQPQPVSLSARPTALKEMTRETGAGLVRKVRAARSLLKETNPPVPSVAKRVEDRSTTLDAKGPSCREGKLLCPQLSPAVQKDPAIYSRSAK